VDTLVVKMVKTITEAGNAQHSTFFAVIENTVMVCAECSQERFVLQILLNVIVLFYVKHV
jgi:hypothetical protein